VLVKWRGREKGKTCFVGRVKEEKRKEEYINRERGGGTADGLDWKKRRKKWKGVSNRSSQSGEKRREAAERSLASSARGEGGKKRDKGEKKVTARTGLL